MGIKIIQENIFFRLNPTNPFTINYCHVFSGRRIGCFSAENSVSFDIKNKTISSVLEANYSFSLMEDGARKEKK